MTGRNLKSANRRRVTIRALKRRLAGRYAFFTFRDLGFYFSAMTRAGAAREYRDVGVTHRSQIRVLGYADVTCRAVLVHMILVLVIEFQ